MFTYDLEIFKTQQRELHRQAAHYRLVKSLSNPARRLNRIYTVIGNALITLGQGLVNRTQAAH